MVLLLALTTLEELPSTVRVDGFIPSALVYKAATASTSDALSIAVFNELHTNLTAVLYAVIFDGIAVDISSFLTTYQSVDCRALYALALASLFLPSFPFLPLLFHEHSTRNSLIETHLISTFR